MEAYRSGHNEAVLKTVWVQAHGGSNPSASATATTRLLVATEKSTFACSFSIAPFALVVFLLQRREHEICSVPLHYFYSHYTRITSDLFNYIERLQNLEIVQIHLLLNKTAIM